MREPSYAEAAPKLVAGALGLDFLNTVEWRGDPSAAGERLTSCDELVLWCEQAGIISAAEAAAAMAECELHPQAAGQLLRAAVDLREAAAAAVMQAPDATVVARLNDRLSGVPFEYRVEPDAKGRLVMLTVPMGGALRVPLNRIAHEVVAVLTANPPHRIRSCTNQRCGWFFIDTSRNSTRRWCQMATCGNQAKARAHYARRQVETKRARMG